jgi:WD40 repeat protein
MEQDYNRFGKDQSKKNHGLYRKWVKQLIALENLGNKSRFNENYTEVLGKIVSQNKEDQLDAFLSMIREAVGQSNENLTMRIYSSLSNLFQDCFKGTCDENWALSQIQSIEFIMSTKFSQISCEHSANQSSSESFAKGKEKEKEKGEKREEKDNAHDEKKSYEEFYQVAQESLMSHIFEPESFKATVSSLLEFYAPNNIKQHFFLLENLIIKAQSNNPEFARTLFNFLYNNVYMLYFNESELSDYYKDKLEDLLPTTVPIPELGNIPSGRFAALHGQNPLSPQIEVDEDGYYEEISSENLHESHKIQWQNRLATGKNTHGIAVIDGVFLSSIKHRIFFISIPNREIMRMVENPYGLPLLVTAAKIPKKFHGLRKKLLAHPTNPSKTISLLWARTKTIPKPKKLLLLKNFLVRGYEDGSIEIDDFKRKTSFSFKEKHSAPITSLMPKDSHKFISAAGCDIKRWNIKKKKCAATLRLDGPVKDIILYHNLLYGLVGNSIVSCEIKKDQGSYFPFYCEEEPNVEANCLAYNEHNLFVGLNNGAMRVFESTTLEGSSLIEVSKGPIETITCYNDMLLVQHNDGAVVLY